ncbi:MAG TPA: SWIM zinc finger family protein [Patescibacteria group bacterium]|nr:SWIM zinc finger family protein [Patescibacteria group bacterium]
MSFTLQQILALAPDDSSAKAGMQLANPSKWLVRRIHPLALWGECQGSGSKPYKTSIDLTNIAFKCSCPSRKFPCKHGLGLLLLYADKAELFANESVLPQEIEEWINKRGATIEAKVQAVKKPVDEDAQQKRIAQREQKILNGIEELQMWIKDIVRGGLIHIQPHSYSFASNIIARMVDSQAPGLAYQLRKINSINFFDAGWQREFIRLLSILYILCEGYKRKGVFSPQLQADLETLIGWTKTKEEVLQGESVRDVWLVLSTVAVQEDALISETTWLYGRQTQRFAYIQSHYTASTKPMDVLLPGASIDADLVFYPGSIPMRCIIREQRNQTETAILAHIGITSIESLKDHVADVLTLAPFTDRIPVLFSTMKITPDNGRWFIKDGSGFGFELSNSPHECWKMLSISRGQEFSFFGLYTNESIVVHSLWMDQKYYTLL